MVYGLGLGFWGLGFKVRFRVLGGLAKGLWFMVWG